MKTVKLMAIHALVLTAAVKGETDDITPGSVFHAREDELHLIEKGAARRLTEAEEGLRVVARKAEQADDPAALANDTEGKAAKNVKKGATKGEAQTDNPEGLI